MTGPTDPSRAVAVCTIADARTDDLSARLHGLLHGLARQTRPADLVSVAVVGGIDRGPIAPHDELPVRWVDLPAATSPAAARNAARATAGAVDDLIFLDVDIIPSSRLVADYVSRLRRRDAVWTGQVDELSSGPLPRRWSDQAFDAAARPHPTRRPPQGDRPLPRPDMFWASSFAVPAAVFDRIGGFDESFVGAGAEDTDFGLRVAGAGIGLWRTPLARGWRQHPRAPAPPAHHLSEVIADSTTFWARWGRWPEEARLRELTAMGLVDWDRTRGHLELTGRGRRTLAASAGAAEPEPVAAS